MTNNNMKIDSVQALVVQVPLTGTFSTSHNVRDCLTSVVVRIRDSAGRLGYGSVDPAPGYMDETAEDVYGTITDKLADLVVGCDPADRRRVAADLEDAAPRAFCARAAVEMAIWDLHGQVTGQSLAQMLGGTFRNSVPLIGWIGLVDPAEAAEQAKQWLQQGFSGLKLKIGSGHVDDLERLKAVRNAVGPEVHIRVDANEHFSRNEAVAFLREAAQYGLDLCEQPIPRGQWEELARLRNEVDIPIMVDEGIYTCEDILAVHRAGAADAIKFKIMKQGGIQATVETIQFAEKLGFRCTVGHGFSLSSMAMTEAVLAATVRQPLLPAEMVGPLKLRADIVESPFHVEGGAVKLPTEKGLGFKISEVKLREYSVR